VGGIHTALRRFFGPAMSLVLAGVLLGPIAATHFQVEYRPAGTLRPEMNAPFTATATEGSASFPNGCGNLPVVVQFQAAVNGGISPFSYAWSFGDGGPNSTMQSPTHSYSSFGEYHVNLTVIDGVGARAFSNISAFVRPPPCPVEEYPFNPNSGLYPIVVIAIVATIAGVGAAVYAWKRPRVR
jgi:hypothetical protein